jgi:signal transduction histidine kinase/CheY-like chemotaxis protein/HPt (histidine-containing phosphotransfer) domain-containing protein
MIEPLSQLAQQVKYRLKHFRWSFEWILIAALICITSSVSYTAYLAYQSLLQLTEAVARGSESEVKLLVIKGVANDLTAAESNIKSFGLSKDKAYLNNYLSSLKNVGVSMAKLDSLIPDPSHQQATFDSIKVYVDQKISYLKEFAQIQERGSVVNELNILSYQIEQNKKILSFYLGDQKMGLSQEGEKPGFLKRLFNGKSIKKQQAEAQHNRQTATVKRLNEQIKMMEHVKGEIVNVKRRQGTTLKSIDEEELTITQKNKTISERMNSFFVSLELDELARTRLLLEDIDKSHQKSDRLISVVSVMGAFFLIVIGFVVISFIRKKNAYQDALLKAKNEAEQYALLQERFLANMSHEIRTPMSAISGFTEQLLKTQLQEKQRSFLDIIQQSTRYLLVVINDILDYAKLKADKLTVESIPFSVEQVMRETLDMLRDTAGQKGISIQLHQTGTMPERVFSDPVRLKQVLLNVLGNALKFTHQGSITVHMKSDQTGSDTANISLQIKDTGIGISKQNLAKIFNAFEQAEVSTARKFGGSGLGLSITQKLVHLLNGTIQMSSAEGEGTEVILLFEWNTKTTNSGAKQIQTIVPQTDLHAVLSGKKVLIADDEEWNTVLLQTVLTGYHIELTVVRNGHETIQALRSAPFDLVLMDVRMPEMDGFEATARIRKLKGSQATVPIIGLTADVTDPQVKRCYQSGMNAVLGKPFSEQQLCELMYQTLQQPTPVQYTPAPVIASSQKAAAQNRGYSIAVLTEMSNGDETFVIRMMEWFMQNGKQSISRMQEAFQLHQYQTIADCAHKMMPAVRQLEAQKLLVLLKNIEKMAQQQTGHDLHKKIEEVAAIFELICTGMQKKIEQLKK